MSDKVLDVIYITLFIIVIYLNLFALDRALKIYGM